MLVGAGTEYGNPGRIVYRQAIQNRIMTGAVLLIFTLLWSGMVLAFDTFMARGLLKQFESASYPAVTGTVTRSEVLSHTGSKGGTHYTADIQYKYSVNGRPYSGNTMRFNKVNAANSGDAGAIVRAHPSGSPVQVYFNPVAPDESLLFPGIAGADFMMVLFLTPFNMIMIAFWLGLWGWFRERLFKPIAGGVKIIEDGITTRVRLPQWNAIWSGLGTIGGLGFLSMFVVGIPTGMQPSFAVVLPAILVVYLAGIMVYLRQLQKINSGIDDLVINAGARTLQLPMTFGRKQPFTVPITDIEALYVDIVEHHNSKGGTTFSYAPTLRIRESSMEPQKLADWGDKFRANEFTKWLSGTLGVSSETAL